MRILGILGGVASGKSFVACQFAQRGAAVLDADQAGHQALRLPHVKTAARQRWGATIFDPHGEIDRRRLAQIVFAAGPQGELERNYLEQLTHPEIARLLEQQAESLRASGVQLAILDAAVMLEAGWNKMCEKLVFVDAPRDVRLARALERGWTKEDFDAREGAQESLDRKRSLADEVIDNAGPPERTQAQIDRLWASLIQ